MSHSGLSTQFSNEAIGELTDVHELCTRIGCVICELKPDVLAIEEGPRSISQIELFSKTYLGDAFDCFGYTSSVGVDFISLLKVEA